MKYYDNIYEMPVYNWFKVIKDFNLGFLLKDSTNKNPDDVKPIDDNLALSVWFKVNNQYYKEFGIDVNTQNVLELKKEIGELKLDYCITGDKFKLTEIEIKENKLKSIDPDDKPELNFNKEVAKMYEYMGFFNTKKITVHEYYTAREGLKDVKQRKHEGTTR
jgi:hypothetical protein